MFIEKITDNEQFEAIVTAVKKFHADQNADDGKINVKRIVMSLSPGMNNPCSGKKCKQGLHPEIFIDPETGAISCRCAKN